MAHGSFGHLLVVVDRATATAATGTLAFTEDDDVVAMSGAVSGNSLAFTEDDDVVAMSGGETVTGTLAFTEADDVVAMSGGGYILNDDFTGSSIDATKWVVYNRLGDQVNSEVNAVIPANVRVTGGNLLIDSKFETVTAGDTTTSAPNPRSVNYTSGQIAQATAPFLYGEVRVRAQIPGGTGLWPCIWMLGTNWQATQPSTANTPLANWPVGGWWELDIAEFMQNHRTVVNNALHFVTANRTGSGEKTLPFDATTRFMVYRLVWTATSLTWYVDAEDGNGWVTLTTMTGTAGTDIPNTAGYLIMHTAIGGTATTAPDSATFPQTMTVDYAQILRTTDTVDQPAGTLFFTDADDTVAMSGAAAVTGTLAFTEADDTVAMSGAEAVVGTLAFTEADDVVAASGGETLTGTVAWTEDDDVVAMSGGSGATGTLAFTEDDDVVAMSGTETTPGTLAFTEDDDTIAATGAELIPGTIAWTEDDDVVAMAGGGIVTGTLAFLEDDDTVAMVGGEAVTGTAAWLEDDDVVAMSGPGIITGTAAWTEDDDVFLASAGITVIGTASWIEDDDVAAFAGTVANTITGTLAFIEDNDVVALREVPLITTGGHISITWAGADTALEWAGASTSVGWEN